MPRPPRQRHPLRDLRKALGKTQAEFGSLVGASAITIKRIENGSLTLSDRMAVRISAATGATRSELLKGAEGKALDTYDKPYTLESYKRWRKARTFVTREETSRQFMRLSEFIEWVCEAATISEDTSLQSVSVALEAAIDGICRDHGLDVIVANLFEEKGIRGVRLPDGSYRTFVNPDLAELMENVYRRLGKSNPGSELPSTWRDTVKLVMN